MPAVIQIDGWDPVAGAAVTLRAASHDDPAVCMLAGQTWWPAIAKLPVLRYDLFDGAFGTAIETPSASLTLRAEPWPNLGRYALADARLRLWTGARGDAWPWTLRFDGRVTAQPKLADGAAELDFAVDDRWLDAAFLTTYAGTTGIEGPAAMKGQVKPLALGQPRYVAGKLIDPVNSVFQLSSYGTVQSIDVALERLARFGAATNDYPGYAALVGAAIPAGAWATCRAAGLARFGAPPAGQVSFLLSGDAAGTDGFVRTPGKLTRRLALLSGGAGKVDDASLNALDAARPYNCSIYLDEQGGAREPIQRLAASVNAVAGVSWTGQLFVAPVEIGAPTVTLAADGSALPPVVKVEQIEIAAPWRSLGLTAERAWTVHGLGDIAFTATLVDLGGYSSATTYREGNIVELPTGGRFMYSAVTPTAGNSPPNAAYWTALPGAAATDFSTVIGPTRPDDNATRNRVTYSTSAPAGAVDGDLWIDLSAAYAVTKIRNGGTWQPAATNLTIYNQLTGKPASIADINATESAKLGGIEAGATASDNMVANAALLTGAAGWGNGAGDLTRTAGVASDPLAFFFHATSNSYAFSNGGSTGAGAIAAAGTLFVSMWLRASSLAATFRAGLFCFAADGSALPTVAADFLPTTATAWQFASTSYVLPAGTAKVSPYLQVYNLPSGGLADIGGLRVAATQPGADVTALSPAVSKLDPTTGVARNAALLNRYMAGLTGSQVYDVNPLSASRSSGTTTIAIASHTLRDDSGSTTFASGSVGGLTGAVGAAYVVYEQGGAYFASLDVNDLTVSSRRWVGTIVVPADGASSAGAGNGSVGGRCVDADSVLPDGRIAWHLRRGHSLPAIDLATGRRFDATIGYIAFVERDCVELLTAGGSRWRGSLDTPFDLPDGGIARAPAMLGEQVWCEASAGWEEVVSVAPIGTRTVAHIYAGNVSYLAGVEPGRAVASHNKPPFVQASSV